MITTSVFVLFALFMVQQTDWVAAGNNALDKGSPEEAAADFARALDTKIREGAPPIEVLSLRITLASAYMESADYRGMEGVLQAAQESAGQIQDPLARAELLNAWSVLHSRQGRLPETEAELAEAHRLLMKLSEPGILFPTVLHNLAALDMRTGRYAEALAHERDAMRRFEVALPPDHPALIRGHASMASLQYMMRRPRDAESSMHLALASAERTFGPNHPLIAQLLWSDAVILNKLGLKKEARAARERAHKIAGPEAMENRDNMTWNLREVVRTRVHLLSK